MDLEFSLGEWIRKRRNALGLTQAALAEQVGYSAAMIRKIENDERRPSVRAATLLAEALKIPQDQQDAFLEVARQERALDQLGTLDQEESFPWQAPHLPQTNLPLPATLLVGREEELARLSDLLQKPDCRLVTVVGLAGIGKTRLALQVARSQLDRYEHGVFFVSLAALDSPEMIVTAIPHAIGFQFRGAGEPQEQLLRYLQEKHMLLVLDNFEHLMEGVELLPTILRAGPGLRLLVTSRERLNLQEEWIFEIEGLTYPENADKSSLKLVESYGAVQLFMQSALRVDPSFSLSEENQKWVVRICQLAAGMPLGIELAAAWVRVLSPQVIAREIERSLDFLKASTQDIPERHGSLRAALDHSWQLLSARERDVFQRLSVFRGGFQREAAQNVAGANLEELSSLLDKSMLKRVGEDRYDLHELVRQYAASHLQSNPQEHAQTHDRYSNYYAALLEQWEEKLTSPRHVETLADMDVEMDNVRLTWSWMLARRQIANIHRSLRSLWIFHELRGRFQEGANLMRRAEAVLKTPGGTETEEEDERSVVLGKVLAQQGFFCAHLGRYDESGELLQQSLALARSGKDRTALAEPLICLGYLEYRLGEYQEAEEYAEEELALLRASGTQWEIVHCLVLLSYISFAQQAYEKAYALSSEGLAICRANVGDPHATAYCLITLSAAGSQLGKYGEAKRWAEESLQLSKTLNDRWSIAQTLRQLGPISFALGETRRAESLIQQSVSLFRELGDRTLMAMALIDLGAVTRTSGKLAESKRSVLEALRIAMDMRTVVIALQALAEIAAIEMKEGATDLALELVTQCLQHPSTNPEVRKRAERLRAELTMQLTPQQIEAVHARAQAKTLEGFAEEILATG
jgi:predicted ATPase/DNA-binding XRE family transcriptional regulator